MSGGRSAWSADGPPRPRGPGHRGGRHLWLAGRGGGRPPRGVGLRRGGRDGGGGGGGGPLTGWGWGRRGGAGGRSRAWRWPGRGGGKDRGAGWRGRCRPADRVGLRARPNDACDGAVPGVAERP